MCLGEKLNMNPKIEKMWAWIDRELPESFFDAENKQPDSDDAQKRWNEIPDSMKLLAYAMLQIAQQMNTNGLESHDKACQLFRIYIFKACHDMGLGLPYYWSTDGVMIEPEWIVRITNGLIGWRCDKSVETCGLEKCRFRNAGPRNDVCLKRNGHVKEQ